MGLIHIYCGSGKGKTTAALGLAIRAAGQGMRVHIVQFMKGSPTGELNSLKLIPQISVERCDRNYGFTFNMNDSEKLLLKECCAKLLRNAFKILENGETDVLILDEFNTAYNLNLLDRELADRLVFENNGRVELVLTGRDPNRKFIDIADYVSEINALKKKKKNGIKARRGIEF